MSLTNRERVRALLAGEVIDQPVVDMGGRVASLHIETYRALKAYLGYENGIEIETVTLLNTVSEFDERVLTRLNIPIRRVLPHPPASFQLQIERDGSFVDEWGVGYVPMGSYNERVKHPLANAALMDLDSFPWPDPDDPGRWSGLREEAGRLYKETGFCLAAGHISAGIFQDCWNLRGMENFMLDLAINREFAEALLESVTEFHVGMWKNFLEAVGDYVDIVETADDLGGQEAMLISPEMYREIVKPRHAVLNEAIRARTSARILYHSCGSIMPVIDDLVEIGVNILNPIQPIPGQMDPEKLKARYGDKLIFHGGLDVQNLLINGDVDDVRRHVSRYYEILGKQRYIMAPANTVQPGTPPANILAAYRAAQCQCN